MEGTQRALEALLAEEPALTGLIVQTEAVIDLLVQVLQQRGKSVPDDVSLVGVSWRRGRQARRTTSHVRELPLSRSQGARRSSSWPKKGLGASSPPSSSRAPPSHPRRGPDNAGCLRRGHCLNDSPQPTEQRPPTTHKKNPITSTNKEDELTTQKHLCSPDRQDNGSCAALVAAGSASGHRSASQRCKPRPAAAIVLTETSYYTSVDQNGPIYSALNTVFSNFEKSHPGITIKREDIVNSGNNYLTEVAAEAAAGTLPDILMLDNPTVPTLASYGVLTPLSTLGQTAIPTLGTAQQAEAKFNGADCRLPAVHQHDRLVLQQGHAFGR